MRICKEILKISTFVGIFCMFCPLWTCILQFYVSLNCYMPKCVSYFPFSCGTLQKSKNWFDVLNFGFSHIHGYSGSTVIRDSRVCIREKYEQKSFYYYRCILFIDHRKRTERDEKKMYSQWLKILKKVSFSKITSEASNLTT